MIALATRSERINVNINDDSNSNNAANHNINGNCDNDIHTILNDDNNNNTITHDIHAIVDDTFEHINITSASNKYEIEIRIYSCVINTRPSAMIIMIIMTTKTTSVLM